jgi:hypothetical protein
MVSCNALTVEDIINGFPNALPNVYQELPFEDIQITTHLINTNAISCSSMPGGGDHGHLGIIMTPVEYVAISNTPWAEPHDPGPIPPVVHGMDPVDTAQLVCHVPS